MNFRETLKKGTMVTTIRELAFYKKHDTHVQMVLSGETPLMIWDFERFEDEIDPQAMIEIEFLHNADLWCLALPHGDAIEDYIRFGEKKEEENA